MATAVVYKERQLSFAALDAAVWRAAASLRQEGLAPGDVVGTTLLHPVAELVSALALARIGAVLAPLPPSEPALARQYLAKRMGAVALIGDNPGAADAGVPVIPTDPDWLAPRGDPIDYSIRHAADEHSLAFITSSGTSGTPKLMRLSHAAQWERLEREKNLAGIKPGEAFLTPSPIHFRSSKDRNMSCLFSGGTAVLPARDANPSHLLEQIERHPIHHFAGGPYHATVLLGSSVGGHLCCPGIKSFRLGNAPVSSALRFAIRERLTRNLAIAYGASECFIVAFATCGALARHPETIGYAAKGVEVQIVDAEDRGLPAGEIGLIRVRGRGVVAGYYDDPEATEKAFRGGWFYPGDLGSFSPDGALFFHGRADDMMIFEGVNIYPSEIETVLEQHPAVVEAAAFPLASERFGQIPAAAVLLKEPVALDRLYRFCGERLGLRRPRYILKVPNMPRNLMNKIIKRELAAMLEAHLGQQRAKTQPK